MQGAIIEEPCQPCILGRDASRSPGSQQLGGALEPSSHTPVTNRKEHAHTPVAIDGLKNSEMTGHDTMSNLLFSQPSPSRLASTGLDLASRSMDTPELVELPTLWESRCADQNGHPVQISLLDKGV